MRKKEFIEKANKIYDNKYDYKCIPEHMDLKPYNNVPIICEKHGLFYQSLYYHLNGLGCFECYKEIQKLTDEQ